MIARHASSYFGSVTISTAIHVRMATIATNQYGKSRALSRKRSESGGFSSMCSISAPPPTSVVIDVPSRGRRTRDAPGRSLARLEASCRSSWLPRDGRFEVRCEVLLADLLQRPVVLHLRQRVVDRGHEVRALREDEPELLGRDATGQQLELVLV